MTPLFFSRARVRPDTPVGPLSRILLGDDGQAPLAVGHRLVWTLFSDDPKRERDFLWRESEPGTFYILSQREPADARGVFDLAPPKTFAPRLKRGDRLAFSLRANATVARSNGSAARGVPCDVVMDALFRVPQQERADARRTIIETEGRRWLVSQGVKCGFSFPESECRLEVLGYQSFKIPRKRSAAARIGVLDFEGVLRVDEPERFVIALAQGFGRAKSFGCGLMLIKRA